MSAIFGPNGGHFEFLRLSGGIICFSWNSLIKKAIYQKLTGVPKTLGVNPFPDTVSHFGAPYWPLWIFEVLIGGIICFPWNDALIKKAIWQKLMGAPKNLRVMAIFGPPGSHFRLSIQWSISGGAALQAVSECPSYYWAGIICYFS